MEHPDEAKKRALPHYAIHFLPALLVVASPSFAAEPENGGLLSNLLTLLQNNTLISVVGVILSIVGAFTAKSTYQRRIKTGTTPPHYFTEAALLSPPVTRPAYSDRMAYVLAELADLAYFQFEKADDRLDTVVRSAQALDLKNIASIRAFLDQYRDQVIAGELAGTGYLRDVLALADFELVNTFNIGGNQGFACLHRATDQPNYLVIAFRGTEADVGDWLTDASANPTIEGDCKVHTGFYQSYLVRKDNNQHTLKQRIDQLLESDSSKDPSGNPLPLFITGHSLGGALAVMATRNSAANVTGACYTFGSPRIANYNYFQGMKTPVYRIVNSSDLVPRVPPGALNAVLLNLLKLLVWLTHAYPAISSLFSRLEEMVDKLNGYRHFGDQRYLTDVEGGEFHTVRLLPNPSAVDRAVWFWRHLAKSLRLPLNNHKMSLYRHKLRAVALKRNS